MLAVTDVDLSFLEREIAARDLSLPWTGSALKRLPADDVRGQCEIRWQRKK